VGYNSNFAARLNATWTDPADGSYPLAEVEGNLNSTSGGVTTYYNLPSSFNGIQFYLNVDKLSVSGGVSTPTLSVHYLNAYTSEPLGDGACTFSTGCYDDFIYTLPSSTSGYQLVQVPWGNFARGGWGQTPTALGCPSCSQTDLNDGNWNPETIGFAWEAQSNNNAGSYAVDLDVDDISFY
jgi:hypothetical protein